MTKQIAKTQIHFQFKIFKEDLYSLLFTYEMKKNSHEN